MQPHEKGKTAKISGTATPDYRALPETALGQLAAIDSDCAAATVKATKAALLLEEKRQNPVELVEVLPGLSIIVIGPSRYLQKISWLRLVELAPLRFLLTGSRRGSEISKI